ncbi:MAG: alpha/beta fold hydrolase [Nakamurella sp.]
MPRSRAPELHTRLVHGHRRAYVLAGSGPALLLLHGLGCDHRTWSPVIKKLARRFTVIAPDLLGHGQSAKPRADYSLGGYANGMRDLLALLDFDRVTVVGHSFGGGIAMQFAYQFPQYTERLMLVAPGGFGRQVNPVLRALTLPGAGHALGLAAQPPVLAVARFLGARLQAAKLPGTADVAGALTVLAGKHDAAERDAFLHVLRAVVDWRGQVVTMTDRSYLALNMPTCVMWGLRDTVLPAAQAEVARTLIPGVRLEIVPGAGHFPHEEFPDRFVSVVNDFVRTTQPSVFDPIRWRGILREGGATADPAGPSLGEELPQPSASPA